MPIKGLAPRRAEKGGFFRYHLRLCHQSPAAPAQTEGSKTFPLAGCSNAAERQQAPLAQRQRGD